MKLSVLAGVLAFVASPTILSADVVDIDNFNRSETDGYFQKRADAGYFGKIGHLREPVAIDNQPVVRLNRDTLYSYAVFDLNSPVTITMPEAGDRFQSLRVINEDHYIVQNTYDAKSYTFDADTVGTRYVYIAIRTLADPENPDDLAAAHDLQDAITWQQDDVGTLELPDWDADQRDAVRTAILQMAPFVPDSRHMFGSKDDVDPVRHLIGTAGGWAGGPAWASYYINVNPTPNDGKTPFVLEVQDVPVDGFWSVSVYNAKGYFQESPQGGYSVNNLTATKGKGGKITVHFGGDKTGENRLSIMPGWNYTVRLYRARPEVLDGSWTFPDAQQAQ